MFSKGLRIVVNGERFEVVSESDLGRVALRIYSAYRADAKVMTVPAAELADMIGAGDARVESAKWDKFTAMISAATTEEDKEILVNARSLACATERPAFLRGKNDRQIVQHCYLNAQVIARWNTQ